MVKINTRHELGSAVQALQYNTTALLYVNTPGILTIHATTTALAEIRIAGLEDRRFSTAGGALKGRTDRSGSNVA